MAEIETWEEDDFDGVNQWQEKALHCAVCKREIKQGRPIPDDVREFVVCHRAECRRKVAGAKLMPYNADKGR